MDDPNKIADDYLASLPTSNTDSEAMDIVNQYDSGKLAAPAPAESPSLSEKYSAGDAFLINMGKGFVDTYRGIDLLAAKAGNLVQKIPLYGNERIQKQFQAHIDEQYKTIAEEEKLIQPLRAAHPKSSFFGSMTGELASVPVPGVSVAKFATKTLLDTVPKIGYSAARIIGNSASGAGQGLVFGATRPEKDQLKSAVTGAVAGLIGGAATSVIPEGTRVINGVKVSPEEMLQRERVVEAAREYGLEDHITAGDIKGRSLTAMIERLYDSVFFLGNQTKRKKLLNAAQSSEDKLKESLISPEDNVTYREFLDDLQTTYKANEEIANTNYTSLGNIADQTVKPRQATKFITEIQNMTSELGDEGSPFIKNILAKIQDIKDIANPKKTVTTVEPSPIIIPGEGRKVPTQVTTITEQPATISKMIAWKKTIGALGRGDTLLDSPNKETVRLYKRLYSAISSDIDDAMAEATPALQQAYSSVTNFWKSKVAPFESHEVQQLISATTSAKEFLNNIPKMFRDEAGATIPNLGAVLGPEKINKLRGALINTMLNMARKGSQIDNPQGRKFNPEALVKALDNFQNNNNVLADQVFAPIKEKLNAYKLLIEHITPAMNRAKSSAGWVSTAGSGAAITGVGIATATLGPLGFMLTTLPITGGYIFNKIATSKKGARLLSGLKPEADPEVTKASLSGLVKEIKRTIFNNQKTLADLYLHFEKASEEDDNNDDEKNSGN